MLVSPPRVVPTLTLVFLLVLGWFLFQRQTSQISAPWSSSSGDKPAKIDSSAPSFNGLAVVHKPGQLKTDGTNYTRVLVMAKTRGEDTDWVASELPGLPTAIYEVDNRHAEFRVPKNKGREAMVYLTYIIDHYDELPDTVLFFHAHRYAWHNNVLLGLDTAETIRRLRDDRVARMGYMPARCHHDPGCPDWIHLDRPLVDYDPVHKPEERDFTGKIWRELHPGVQMPMALSQPCCAQFAVSRDRIQQTPLQRYVQYRDWLLKTRLDDQSSGRVFEYIWQYIFTGHAEFCPIMHTCYCDGFGICFGSAAKLDEWLKSLKDRELLEGTLKWLSDNQAPEQNQNKVARDIEQLNEKMERERMEAYARGDAENNREIERERSF